MQDAAIAPPRPSTADGIRRTGQPRPTARPKNLGFQQFLRFDSTTGLGDPEEGDARPPYEPFPVPVRGGSSGSRVPPVRGDGDANV